MSDSESVRLGWRAGKLRAVNLDTKDRSLVGMLVLLVVAGGILTVALLGDEPPNGHGIPHPRIDAMRAGGDGVARAEGLLGSAVALGAVLIAVFAIAIRVGASSASAARAGRGLGSWLAIATAGWLAVWIALVLSYRAFSRGGPPQAGELELFLGFPAATAWMIYGLWIAPVAFTLIYFIGFDRWIYTADDERRFEALLAEQRGERAEADPLGEQRDQSAERA